MSKSDWMQNYEMGSGVNPQRKHAQHKADRYTANYDSRYFVAIDGEGANDGIETETKTYKDPNRIPTIIERTKQRYTLLGASDGSYIHDASGLSAGKNLRYLFKLLENHPNGIFVGYGFSYDVEMILRDIPLEQMEKLLTGKSIRYRIDAHTYQFTYMRGKKISISKIRGKEQTTITIYDVIGFYQTAFVPAMVNIGVLQKGSDDYELLAGMKEKRDEFTDEMLDSIIEYNLKECTYLVAAMSELRAGLLSLGIRVTSWHGAGAIAMQMYKMHDVKEHLIDPETCGMKPVKLGDEIAPAPIFAYFGGRIEMKQAGFVESGYGYDINSAYPSVLAELPSRIGGEWVHYTSSDESVIYEPVSCVHVQWLMNTVTPIGPLPFRNDDGSVQYPYNGEGWYWCNELRAVLEMKEQHPEWFVLFRVIESYVCEGIDPNSRPFEWIKKYFELRKELKARGRTAEQIAVKLGLNSLYGKLAQRIGGKILDDGTYKKPSFQDYVYAGMITAGTRAALLRAMMTNPYDIVTAQTDGLVSKTPLIVRDGSALGQWESKEITDGFFMQAGFYTYSVDGKVVNRTRGIHADSVDWDLVKSKFSDMTDYANYYMSVKLSARIFIGSKQAIIRNKPEMRCTWINVRRDLKLIMSHVNKFEDVVPIEVENNIVKLVRFMPGIVAVPSHSFKSEQAQKWRDEYDDSEHNVGLSR